MQGIIGSFSHKIRHLICSAKVRRWRHVADSDSARKWTKIGESVVELTKRGRVHLWKGDKGWQSLIKETKITRRYKML